MAGYAGYDMAAAILVILFAVLGLAGGLLRQIVRILAVALGGWAALMWGPEFIHKMGISMGQSATLIVPLLVFLVVYIVIVLIGAIILKVIHATSPVAGLIDRILGLALGALKGAILVYMITSIIIFAAGSGRIRGMGTHNSMVYNWVQANPITISKAKKIEKTIRTKVTHVLKEQNKKLKKALKDDKDATQGTYDPGVSKKTDK